MAIRDEVLKELLKGYKKPEDLLGPEGLLKKLTAALAARPTKPSSAAKRPPPKTRDRGEPRRRICG